MFLLHLKAELSKLLTRAPFLKPRVYSYKLLAMYGVLTAKKTAPITSGNRVRGVSGWNKLRVVCKSDFLKASALQPRLSDPDIDALNNMFLNAASIIAPPVIEEKRTDDQVAEQVESCEATAVQITTFLAENSESLDIMCRAYSGRCMNDTMLGVLSEINACGGTATNVQAAVVPHRNLMKIYHGTVPCILGLGGRNLEGGHGDAF